MLHVSTGLGMVIAVKLDATQRLDPQRLGQWWAQRLLHILAIRLTVHGTPYAGGHVIVANHVSWLDIFVLLASRPTAFVAKSEIRDWPIAGWLANALGTFYIRRGKGASAPLVERLLPYLQSGGTVVIFPEGTTSDGRQILPFHARLFAAVVESGAVVQPTALRYGLSDKGVNLAPFVDDDDLLSHLRRLLKVPSLQAELHYGPAMMPDREVSREQWATRTQRSVECLLALPETQRKPRRRTGTTVSTSSEVFPAPQK